MPKPQVHKLNHSEHEYDFILVGLICQHKDYKLCFELNRKLDLNLAKCDDHELFLKDKKASSLFSKFMFKNHQGDQFILLANKGSRGILLPEQPQLDFIFIISENHQQGAYDNVLKSLKEIPVILGTFQLDPSNLPSREHLIME